MQYEHCPPTPPYAPMSYLHNIPGDESNVRKQLVAWSSVLRQPAPLLTTQIIHTERREFVSERNAGIIISV
jgi:hypothetical protein